MTRRNPSSWLLAAVAFGLLAMGCQSGGVGDPCTPEDEYRVTFSGFSQDEVNIENRSFQCTTRVCLVNHFRGRVSCPYGQGTDILPGGANASGAKENEYCHIPGTCDANSSSQQAQKACQANRITVPVQPQIGGQVKFGGRQAADAVYCSCRCAGPDPNAKYCSCPSGYHCPSTYLEPDVGLGNEELAGSYCVRDGTDYNPTTIGPDCSYGSKKGDPDYCGNNGVNP